MNAYDKRMRQHRQRKQKTQAAYNEIARLERMTAADVQMSDYERAYEEAYGRKCHLFYKGGWCYMAECATWRVRLKYLGAAAQELRDAAAHGLKPKMVGAPIVGVLLDEIPRQD